ncbi:hypothetical protein [Sphingomonas sp.]|uniref:hypothetical protein n=1 Tax=Sphingomonas sp. TaxID=28214 RepID=UPI000DB4FB7B|nr:hypothetical protein [Sphingomonas sp.]PZU09837.1 MAG: hypothetical protein DI605_09495 [Sphingomonas sp.]
MRIMRNIGIGLVLAAAIGGAADAQRFRASSRSVQGAYGRGYTASRTAERGGGTASVTSGVQTNGGYGVANSRGHSVSDGTYTGGATHTTNNGTTWGRTTTATANGNGTGSYATTFTGPAGGSTTVSGNVSHAQQ